MQRRQFLFSLPFLCSGLAAASSKKTVGFLGDSIFALGGWQTFLPEVRVLNFGVSGNRTDQMIDRFQNVLEGHPDILFIAGGLNDIEAEIKPKKIASNIIDMAEMARAAGMRPIICTTLYVTRDRAGKRNKINVRLAKVNESLRDWSSKFGFPLLDTNRLDVTPAGPMSSVGMLREQFTVDGAHPNAAGNANLAAIFSYGLRLAAV